MKVADSETRWVKIGEIRELQRLGKEAVMYGRGCHLIFLNLTTGEELVYTANNTTVGDGVKCCAAHRIQNVFAFAEKRSNPVIFLKNYPHFEQIYLFRNGDERGYVCMGFSETSFLITIGELPNFTVTVWNWKLGEKIASHEGAILMENQILKSSLGSPVFLAQLGVDTKMLHVWDIFMCCKRCILTQHTVKFDEDCGNITKVVWTSEGGLFTLDSAGCIYTVLPDHRLEKVIDFSEPGDYPTCFVWYKSGLAVSGPNNEIRHYKKSGTWNLEWSMVPIEPIRILTSVLEYLVAVTMDSNVIQIHMSQNSSEYIKRRQNRFDNFCLIYPTGLYIMALCQKRCINLYKVETGELMSFLDLEDEALTIVENPKFPYAALGFQHGVVKLISAHDPEKLVRMTKFVLTKDPIDSIRFNLCGTVFVAANILTGIFFVIEGLPGGQMEIIAHVDTKRQIADYMLAMSQDCYRVFMVPVTSTQNVAGNVVLRYCIIKKKKMDIKEYSFDDKHLYFNRIVASTGTNRDRLFYLVPSDGKMIYEVEIKRGGVVAKVVERRVTGHQMCDFHFTLDKKIALTWGYDGFIIARGSNFSRNVAIALPHHRMEAGVKKAYIDPYEKNFLSLGRDSALICTNLTRNDVDSMLNEELEDLHNSEVYQLLFSRKTVGFIPKGIYEGKCYLEVEQMKKIETERVKCQKERESILAELKSIKRELQGLLTQNIEGPDNEKLDLKEFNLNVRLYEEKSANHRKLRKATETYLKRLIEAQNKISDFMIENFWSKMQVQGTAIKAIFASFEVTNYVLRPQNPDRENILQWIRHKRKIERYLNDMRAFRPWEPIPEENLVALISARPSLPEKVEELAVLTELDAPEIAEEEEEDVETKISFSGSDLAHFIDVQEAHYLQFELQTYFQTELQWIISKTDSYKLKEYFNEKFNKVMIQKVKEIGNIKERNARLRHIVSELNYFSEDKISITIEDPEWKQTETPELIIQVKDDEVPTTPYISPSEQAILDAKAAEAERIRLLLLADDFREKALMAMMNGVLEVRWEDELKKEVPLPKCMIEKEPEQYNEDDLRAVKDYEEKVQILHNERTKYKTLLRAEYKKVAHSVREFIRKFNERLAELLKLKLSVDSAISQESLKIARMKLFQYSRRQMLQREQDTLQQISHNDEVTTSLFKLMNTLHESVNECRNYAESFQTKDKILERSYKKDVQDMPLMVQEQALKLYRKRTKMTVRSINSATMLDELARCITTNAKSSPILNNDCLEFLKQMDILDQYVGIPTIVDEHIFAVICKHRRLRIEYEIKQRSAQLQLSEAEATSTSFQKRLQQKKEVGVKLHDDLNKIRQELIVIVCNKDVQIVMQRGLVEIPLTGSIEDFKDAVLICRKDVEDINEIILDFGRKKIKVLRQGMFFRRKIMALEWEHRRRRMLIEDLKEKLTDIEGVKLTKEIQYYLKTKDKDKAIPFETEVDMIKGSYENTIQDRKDHVNKINKQIAVIKKHDKTLEKKIADLNVDVCEFNMQKDHELDEKERSVIDTRIKTLLKRSKLVQQIQDNHHEILMLQTELELLRLKTFPTLKYKVV